MVDYCNSNDSAKDYFLSLPLSEYNPFNLLMIDLPGKSISVGNNRNQQVMEINDGIGHVISNSPKLDSDWLKSKSLQAKFCAALESCSTLDEFEQTAFDMLQDDTFCGDDPLVSEQGNGMVERVIGMGKGSRKDYNWLQAHPSNPFLDSKLKKHILQLK